MTRALRRTGKVISAGAGAAALLGFGYVGITWARYGKVARDGRSDPLLDRFMPAYEIRELHQTKVGAPAEVTYASAQELDFQQSALVKVIFIGREVLMGAKPAPPRQPRSFLSEVLALGWRVLSEEPGRHLVMGAVTQPWKADVQFRGLPPEEFLTFNEPGYAKIVWTIAVEPEGRMRSVFHTETRVTTTDLDSRRRLRRYWSLVSPGIRLIRHEMLRLVRQEAERRTRTQHFS
jgi:hypothetical protein